MPTKMLTFDRSVPPTFCNLKLTEMPSIGAPESSISQCGDDVSVISLFGTVQMQRPTHLALARYLRRLADALERGVV